MNEKETSMPNDAAPRGGQALLEALRARLWRPTAGEARAIGLALAIKTLVALLMLAFAFNYAALADAFGLHEYFRGAQNLLHRWYTGNDTSSWYLPLVNWDAQHYLLLSDWGYNMDYDKTGGRQFFPLYPVLIRIFSAAMPVPAAALLLNYIFVAGIAVFLHRLGVHFQCSRPHLAVLVLMTFPTAFFMSAAYTEPLFVFLFMGFIYHFLVTRSRAQLAYCALIPLTRGSAAFALGGLLLYTALNYIRARIVRPRLQKAAQRAERKARRKHRRKHRVAGAPPPAPSFDWRPYALCILAFAAGVAAYLAFFQAVVGDGFAGINAQSSYGPIGTPHSVDWLFNPRIFIRNFFAPTIAPFHSAGAVFDRIMLVLMFAAIAVFAARREWGLLCFYFAIIYGHSAMSIGAGSFSRFALIAAPFLALVLAQYARSARQTALVYALCAVMFAAQLYLAARFSVNIWVA